MTTADFLSWLKDWFSRHPLKAPAESLQASYREEVMARIRTAQAPAPAFQWLPRPRLAFALGTAVACLLALVVLTPHPSTQLTQEVEQAWQLLSELGEDTLTLDLSDLDEEVKTLDQLMLAEAQPAMDDEPWIAQTLELLEGLEADESIPPSLDDTSDEDWLDEFRWLDEAELASS